MEGFATLQTYITLRQGAIMVESGNEGLDFDFCSANQLGKRRGIVDVVFLGYQYAESPQSNQSQTLKNSPLGASRAGG